MSQETFSFPLLCSELNSTVVYRALVYCTAVKFVIVYITVRAVVLHDSLLYPLRSHLFPLYAYSCSYSHPHSILLTLRPSPSHSHSILPKLKLSLESYSYSYSYSYSDSHLHSILYLLSLRLSSRDKKTPLMCAAQRGHIEAVLLLLDEGKDIKVILLHSTALHCTALQITLLHFI